MCACHKNAFVEFIDPENAWQLVQDLKKLIREGADYNDAFDLKIEDLILSTQVAYTSFMYHGCLSATSQYHIEYEEAEVWKRTLLSRVENPSTAKFKDVLLKDFCIAGAYSVQNGSGDYIPFQAFSMRRNAIGWTLESTGLYTGVDSSKVSINREVCNSRTLF